MKDLPRIRAMDTSTLSRKRTRDSQQFKAYTHYTVHGHPSDHQTYINDDPDVLPPASSSSTWKRRRLSRSNDDSGLELELDSAPPSPWIDNYCQPSPLELTGCTTPNEEQDLPKERKRHREEWEELKGLYLEAVMAYGSSHDPHGTLNLLHHVIEECHAFLVEHKDPSILFTPLVRNQDGTWSPQNLSGPDERLFRNWSETTSPSVLFTFNEHPTAFHTVCGSALLWFGNLLAEHPSLGPVAETYGRDWSGTDYCYWLAALDVFEAGDSLPNRSKTVNSFTSEDWRMSLAWGYTLVCLAKAVQTRSLAAENLPPSNIPVLVEEPKWPPDSPFHPSTSKRPPLTRRLHLQKASTLELLLLARDHFYRGMLHMPRSGWSPAGLFNSNVTSSHISETLASSMAREFIKISADILSIAEHFEEPSERQTWAQFADTILNALNNVENKRWKGSILLARGKCKLASGVAKMQELGMDAQEPSLDVLSSYRAQYARKMLSAAIPLLEQARQAMGSNREEEKHSRDLLITALQYSGDLCTSPGERSEFYVRAQALRVGGEEVVVDVTV